MHKTVTVAPLPDGTNMRGNWQVKVSGGRVSRHTKKSAAKRNAKKEANSGDTLKIKRLNGETQDVRTVR